MVSRISSTSVPPRFWLRFAPRTGTYWLGMLLAAAWVQVDAGDLRTRQPGDAGHWLQLETERREYQRSTPAEEPDAARQRDQRLWMQGQRDRELLLRQQQSSAADRQSDRTDPQDVGSHRRDSPDLTSKRQLRSRQLQNSLQRRSWRY